MTIRAGIFFVAGIVTIIFRKQLNSIKNKFLLKFHIKEKDETKFYIVFGIISLIISVILFIIALKIN